MCDPADVCVVSVFAEILLSTLYFICIFAVFWTLLGNNLCSLQLSP